ncbi:hypothetical protein CAPTEDRAFT_228026 [Capitella teleta]|uniref:G-protein coupled receptors family 1 profile domain-containing protein n=1 Tax=Capitella teleta TaxID=283909 RepID=R7VC71_CAPTE|nr:hypothetical protein CAPTEDRAFT_228026 [Capitella teleta]|eukprot:ELU16157.1 hypothetical protein CAPTEDRAFT_228026 [Capitella teleta]
MDNITLSSSVDLNITSTVASTAASTAVDLLVTTVLPHLPHGGVWVAFQTLHGILAVCVLIANCASLGVIYGVVPRLTPPLQLLTSVAFADLLAPWAVMTQYFPRSTCQDEIHTALMLTAHHAGAMSLMALACIHSVATFRPLQYERVISQRRTWIIINLIWLVALLTANVHFLATLTHHHTSKPYCLQVRDNLRLALVLAACLSGATALITGLMYGRILLHLKPIQSLMTPDDATPRKSTKGVVTGVMLASSFVIGWLPFIISKFAHISHAEGEAPPSLLVALNTCMVLVLLNCLLDPIIYGNRMTNMELAYTRLYHRARGWVATTWSRVRRRHDMDELPSTPLNPIESIC